MSLIHWEPARELGSLQTEMNRLFSSFADPQTAPGWRPPLDVAESDDGYLVAIDLPGVRQEEIAIELENNVLTVSGERQPLAQQDGARRGRRERPSGAFRRTLTLPDGVDPGQVQASFSDGVLAIQISKPQTRRPHRVQISMGDRDLLAA